MGKVFPLHNSVFHNDIVNLSQLLRTHNNVGERDFHGNTALHLAVMLGHKDCVHLLLAHNAPVKIKNSQGWSPLAEAISYGDRQTITSLLRKLKQQSRESLESRRSLLIKALKDLGNFYLDLKWDFNSWLPLVSRILPSDLCKISKKGSCIRVDTTLVDFNNMKWERGDITFIFNGETKPSKSLTVLDNKLKVYQRIRYQESEQEIEDEIDILMSSDIVAAQMSTKNISFTRTQSGWLFKEDRSETIGAFACDCYNIQGLTLESRKRREHLTDEDLVKNKAIMENLSKGNLLDNCDIKRRKSLPPPDKCEVKWEDYWDSDGDYPPALGRHMINKENQKTFRATVAMSSDFPMTITALIDVLEVVAPFKQFSKLREFMQSKLPPGFPVKIEIPVFPTITAKITFQDFLWSSDIPDDLFTIPDDYIEDPTRFPDL